MFQLTIKPCLIAACFLLAAVLIQAKPQSKQSIPMPASCLDKDFCFEPHTNYPQKLIDDMVETTHLGLLNRNKYEQKFEDRQSINKSDESDESDCESTDIDDLIYQIVDDQGQVRVVVQTDTKFQQRIKMWPCKNPGQLSTSTIHFSENDFNYFNIACVDVMFDYQFLVLTHDWSGMELVRSRSGIPVYCSCRYERKSVK